LPPGAALTLKALGVAAAGIDDTQPFIAVDNHLLAADGVWSVGDVTGAGAFTHVAMYQARIAASDILGQAHEPASYRALPRVTFTDPEVGAVGLTEAQARSRSVTMQTAVSSIPSSSRGWIHGPGNDGFIKLIADADAGMLIGATSAGPSGGEVLGALAVAVHARIPVAVLSQMIYAYPTFHRAIEDAITQLSLRRPDRITVRAIVVRGVLSVWACFPSLQSVCAVFRMPVRVPVSRTTSADQPSGTNPSHGNVHSWTASPSRSPGPRPRPGVDERDISASQREVPDKVVRADVRERPQLVQLII
jgi:hypothetical protein